MNKRTINEILHELKVASDKRILYKLLFEVRTTVIKNEVEIKKFQECDGIIILIPFLSKPYEKILEIVLSTLGNCCMHAECGIQAFENGIIPPLITLISNIPNPNIQGRGFRLLGNLAKHDKKIIHAIQEHGGGKVIYTILDETPNIPVLLMAVRLFKQLWDDSKFQTEIIALGGISKLMKILLDYLTNENTSDENDSDIDPTQVQIKTACGRDRTVTRQKFNYMIRDFDIHNTVEKITPEKKSYDNKFLLPENREVLELISAILRTYQIVTAVSVSRIAEQFQFNCAGYLCLVFLADEDSPFRANALKILSNLVSNISARVALGSADVIILATNLLTSTSLKKSLDAGEIRYCIRIICLLTGDSCNRAKIRYSGALAELLKRARITKCEKEFAIILYALYQFRFDQVSTNLLVDKGLVPILIRRLSEVILTMKTNHIAQKVEDGTTNAEDLKETKKQRQVLKRTRDLSPAQTSNKSLKQLNMDYDPPCSPSSSSGYGSSGATVSLSPTFSCVSPRTEVDTDFDSDTYSPVCSDDEDGASIKLKGAKKETSPADDDDSMNSKKDPETFDIFSFLFETYDESLQFPPSDTEDNDKSKEEKEAVSCLDANFDFEKNPVTPILMLLQNAAATFEKNKYNMDLVRPETLTTLLKLSQLVPRPNEKLLLILGNVLRHSKSFVPILHQNFVYELSELKHQKQPHADCKSCEELKSFSDELMSLLGTVGESGYGRGEIAHFLLTGDKVIQKRSAIMTTYIIKDPQILNTLLFDCHALRIVLDTILNESESLSNEASMGLTTLAINLKVGIFIEPDDALKLSNNQIYDNESFDEIKSTWSDELVTFILNQNSEVTRVQFCQKILQEKCDVFNSMLSTDFRESKDKEIKLIEVSEGGLKYFLYLLTLRKNDGDIMVIPLTRNMDSALEAYEMSIKYMLHDMELALFNTIKILLDENNALKVFEWSLDHVNNETLEISVYYFINANISGDKKVTLFRNASKSVYSDKWQQLIVETILHKCSSSCE